MPLNQKSTMAIALLVLVITVVVAIAMLYKKESFTGGSRDVTTVHYHYTNWCGFCKRMSPIWDRVQSELPGSKYRFIKYDEDLVRTPGVKGFPTIFVERAGVKTKYSGEPDAEKLKAFIEGR